MKYKFLFTPLGLNAHWCFPCDAFGVGTAIAGIANMIGTANANSQNVRMQEEINQRNISNQWKMFHAQNARQDYLNRNQDLIKRQSLAAAGLNVNSEFGGYPNLATNSIPLAEQKAAQVQPIDASLFAEMMQQAPLIEAQVKNINADTKKKEAETTNTEVDTLLKDTQNWRLQELTPSEKENIREQSNLFKQEAEKARVSVPFIQKQMELCQSQIASIDVETSFALDSYDKRLLQLDQQIAYLQSQGDLNYAQAAVAYKSIEVMNRQMRLIESQISLNEEQYLYLSEAVQNLAIDGNYKQFELDIKRKYGDKTAAAILENINEETLNLRSEQHWRPVSVIVNGASNAAAAAGVATGGVATGLNQGRQFMQGIRKTPKIGF